LKSYQSSLWGYILARPPPGISECID